MKTGWSSDDENEVGHPPRGSYFELAGSGVGC